jgi:hypothetical protein
MKGFKNEENRFHQFNGMCAGFGHIYGGMLQKGKRQVRKNKAGFHNQ